MLVKINAHVALCALTKDGCKRVMSIAYDSNYGNFYVKANNQIDGQDYFVLLTDEKLVNNLKDLRSGFMDKKKEYVNIRFVSALEQGVYPYRLFCFLDEQNILLCNEDFCMKVLQTFNYPVNDKSSVTELQRIVNEEQVDQEMKSVLMKCADNDLLTEMNVLIISKMVAGKDRNVCRWVLKQAEELKALYTENELKLIFEALIVMNVGAMAKNIRWAYDVVVNYNEYMKKANVFSNKFLTCEDGEVITVEVLK